MITLMTKLMLDELDKKKKVTLDQIYIVISNHPEIKIERRVLKHRIRARLYSLEHSKKIKRVGRVTFAKT